MKEKPTKKMDQISVDFIENIQINVKDSDETIIEYIHQLCKFIITSNLNGHLLYSAQMILVGCELLHQRNHADAWIHLQLKASATDQWNSEIEYKTIRTILDDPIEYCALKILKAPGGEESIADIWRTLKSLKMMPKMKNIFQKFYGNIVGNAYGIQLQNIAQNDVPKFDRKQQILLLYITLNQLNVKEMPLIINRIVHFHDTTFTFEHLMLILLTEQHAFGYEISLCIYQHCIDCMRQRSIEFLTIFWTKLLTIFNAPHLIELFFKCCQLIDFYEAIESMLIDYLTKIEKKIDDDGMDEWIIADRNDPIAYIQFEDIGKVVAAILSPKSMANERFSARLRTITIDREILQELSQFNLIYRF